MQIIGQHIRELRIKKGIGSQELASFLGIPPETLLLIETNRIHATKSQVFSIAAYLGANENDLLRAYQ
jgi:DNA-binding XRE family transcriptional regulator